MVRLGACSGKTLVNLHYTVSFVNLLKTERETERLIIEQK